MFDKNKTKHLEYQEVKPALMEAGKTSSVQKKRRVVHFGEKFDRFPSAAAVKHSDQQMEPNITEFLETLFLSVCQ